MAGGFFRVRGESRAPSSSLPTRSGKIQEQWRSIVRGSARIRVDATRHGSSSMFYPRNQSSHCRRRSRESSERSQQSTKRSNSSLPPRSSFRCRAANGIGRGKHRDCSTFSSDWSPAKLRRVSPTWSPSRTPLNQTKLCRDESSSTLAEVNVWLRCPFPDPVYRLAPGAWLVPPGDDAEITLRLAVAMPNVLPLGGSGSTQLVTQLGDSSEELLVELLDASPVTEWLRSLRPIWHWDRDVEWTPAGSGSPLNSLNSGSLLLVLKIVTHLDGTLWFFDGDS